MRYMRPCLERGRAEEEREGEPERARESMRASQAASGQRLEVLNALLDFPERKQAGGKVTMRVNDNPST